MPNGKEYNLGLELGKLIVAVKDLDKFICRIDKRTHGMQKELTKLISQQEQRSAISKFLNHSLTQISIIVGLVATLIKLFTIL